MQFEFHQNRQFFAKVSMTLISLVAASSVGSTWKRVCPAQTVKDFLIEWPSFCRIILMVHSQRCSLKLDPSILWACGLCPSLVASSGAAAVGGRAKSLLLLLNVV
jgi:hypothetical protein